MLQNNIYQYLEDKAVAFRAMVQYSPVQPISFESLLLQLNVISSFQMMSDKLSGMALKVVEKNSVHRFMLVNSNHNVGRQNFTVCHELYHLYIQENFNAQFCNTGKFDEKKDIEEFKADVFAAILLIPAAGVRMLIPPLEQSLDDIHLATIIKIEQYYQCSRLALLYRLKSLGYISQGKVEFYRQNVKKGAYQHGYDTKLYEKDREGLHIGDYGDLANFLYEVEKISEGHYMTLMDTVGVNIFELINGEEEHG
jgi:Zn-dependent peptidase ImmA (M78 family)